MDVFPLFLVAVGHKHRLLGWPVVDINGSQVCLGSAFLFHFVRRTGHFRSWRRQNAGYQALVGVYF